jgi:hypothetical protein
MGAMIRGYAVLASGRFILDDAAMRKAVPKDVLDLIAEQHGRLVTGVFYPLEEVLKLWRAIAKASSSEAKAYENLIRCGEFAAAAALGTFLKFMLKVLTPRMFAKQFPQFWAHDFRGGRIDIDKMEDNSMRIAVREIAGFEHMAPIAVGFVGFAIRATGLKNVVIDCKSWSMAKTDPDEVIVDVTWQ